MEMPTAAMSTSKLMELPHDILLNIFSRLPATSLLQFQCVSKSALTLVNDPALAAMHLAATNEHIDVEVRVLSRYGYKYLLQFVSCGLLGFRFFGPYGVFGLYNPLRGEYLRLPQPEVRYDYNIKWERYGMGFDSVTSTHKIVHFFCRYDYDSNHSMVAHVHVLGTSSWRRIPSVPPCSLMSRESAYAYGNMHWLVEGNRIISFDFEKEEFGWTNPPHLNFPSESQLFLINLRGSIALVDVYLENKVEIWVYKLEKKYWTKDYSMDLGYSGPGGSYSVGAWEHGIYIIVLHANISPVYSDVVYYDLRCGDMRGVPDDYWKCQKQLIHMFSYTGSLISLKKYDNSRMNDKREKNSFDVGDSEFPEHLSKLKVSLDY